MKPLVSIVIPVYNGENYLSQAIDSALSQTYDNIEVIVVNDGSEDDGATERIALSYGDKIRYFSKENGGVSSALNMGIEKMKGEYFSWLSHDDLYTPTKIEKQAELIKEDNKECVYMCAASFIDEDSKPLKRDRMKKKFEPGCFGYDEMLLKMFHGSSINGCALLVPKKLFEKFGVFNTEFRYMQDTDMWYRFLTGGVSFSYSDDLGVLSRVHPLQTTVLSKDLGRKDADIAGAAMVNRLAALGERDTFLLKEYMFLCCRRDSSKTRKLAFETLDEKKQLTILDKIKYVVIFLYGKTRPTLVRLYYKLFFNIRVKK
jgi:hypothetical protein